MLNINEATARRIIDALARAIDGKPSSAKTFQKAPFTQQSDLSWWEQYAAPNDTRRTEALTVAYLFFSGGRIPVQGIQMQDAYFRPDQYIVGAFLKNGRFQIDEATNQLVFTQTGWDWMAGVLETMKFA
jgi:hypothetical protein